MASLGTTIIAMSIPSSGTSTFGPAMAIGKWTPAANETCESSIVPSVVKNSMTRRQFLFLPLTLLAPQPPHSEPTVQLHEKHIQAIEMMADSFEVNGVSLRHWLNQPLTH